VILVSAMLEEIPPSQRRMLLPQQQLLLLCWCFAATKSSGIYPGWQ